MSSLPPSLPSSISPEPGPMRRARRIAWLLWLVTLIGSAWAALQSMLNTDPKFQQLLLAAEGLFFLAAVNLALKVVARRSGPKTLGVKIGMTLAMFALGHALLVAVMFAGCVVTAVTRR